MKKVIVACGGAVATSTIAGEKVKEIGERIGVPVELVQCRINEIESNLTGVDFIVTTSKVKTDYGIPLVHGMAFVSGIGIENLEAKIEALLKGEI